MEIEAIESNTPGTDNGDTAAPSLIDEIPVLGIGGVFVFGILLWLLR
jgi:hypothetical protein